MAAPPTVIEVALTAVTGPADLEFRARPGRRGNARRPAARWVPLDGTRPGARGRARSAWAGAAGRADTSRRATATTPNPATAAITAVSDQHATGRPARGRRGPVGGYRGGQARPVPPPPSSRSSPPLRWSSSTSSKPSPGPRASRLTSVRGSLPSARLHAVTVHGGTGAHGPPGDDPVPPMSGHPVSPACNRSGLQQAACSFSLISRGNCTAASGRRSSSRSGWPSGWGSSSR